MRYLLFFIALSAYGQTGIKPDQLTESTSKPSAAIKLLAVTDDGFRFVRLGPGLTVAVDADGYLSLSVQPVAIRYTVLAPLTRNADGTYIAPQQSGAFFRNGLIQTAGADYTLELGLLRPLRPWATSDSVVILYTTG